MNRMFRRSAAWVVIAFAGSAAAFDEPIDKVPHRMDRPQRVGCSFDSVVEHAPANVITGRYASAVIDQWLDPAPKANPAMLDIFRDHDRKPYRQMEPWAGEFAGKYLT